MAGWYEHVNEAPLSMKGGDSVGSLDNYYLQKWNSTPWSLLVFIWDTGRRNNVMWLAKIFLFYILPRMGFLFVSAVSE
jgi:hypothetical protein